MSRSHEKYAINEEMSSDYTEVPVNPCRSPARGILQQFSWLHPRERNCFFAKIKVSVFVNFEEEEEEEEIIKILKFLCTVVTVYFTYS